MNQSIVGPINNAHPTFHKPPTTTPSKNKRHRRCGAERRAARYRVLYQGRGRGPSGGVDHAGGVVPPAGAVCGGGWVGWRVGLGGSKPPTGGPLGFSLCWNTQIRTRTLGQKQALDLYQRAGESGSVEAWRNLASACLGLIDGDWLGLCVCICMCGRLLCFVRDPIDFGSSSPCFMS